MLGKELSIDEMLKLPNGTKIILETDNWGKELEKANGLTTKQGDNLDVGKEHYWLDEGVWKIFNRTAYLYDVKECCLTCMRTTFTKKDNDKRVRCTLRQTYVEDNDCCQDYK